MINAIHRVAWAMVGVLCLGAASASPLHEQLSVPRVDGTLLDVQVHRPASAGKVPLLVFIDGSLCIPSTLNDSVAWLQQQVDGPHPFALAVIEKPGTVVPPRTADGGIDIGPEFRCSDAFRQHYTLDQRVIDHLRALQYLHRHAPWWNGALWIWGFSDGGRIGAQLAAYAPQTTAVALIGFGGGTPMAESMQDVVCGANGTPTTCRQELRARMDTIRAEPVPGKDWMGEANTFAVWAGRLDAVEANVLRDLRAPLLVVHGERDGSVPVASARKLATAMQGAGVTFRYVEVPGMRHSLWSTPTEAQALELHRDVLDWLRSKASGEGDSEG